MFGFRQMDNAIDLGHKCTNRGILSNDSKDDVTKNYPKPANADKAKRLVAFCNYYRSILKWY